MTIGIGSHVKRGGSLWPEETGRVVAGPNERGHWIVIPDNLTSWREPWADPIELPD